MSISCLYGTTAGIARKHSRMSLAVAAVAAATAAGMLGAVGAAAGTAPWTQVIGSVVKTAQGDSQQTSGQSGTLLFGAGTSVKARDGKPMTGVHLDALRFDGTADSTSVTIISDDNSAPSQAQLRSAFGWHTVNQAQLGPAFGRHTAKQAAERRASAKPYLIYDSVTPSSIPVGQVAAVYANGAYAASSAQMARHHSVLWIDVNGSDPAANVLDVEPGDASPTDTAHWVRQRLSSRPRSVAVVYTMLSDWQQVKDNVATLPLWMRAKVRYWIADPTGVPHIVAGADATQWYWGSNYDITTAKPNFLR
jgi:hypothetical protein